MDDIDRLLRQRSMDDLTGLSGGGSLGLNHGQQPGTESHLQTCGTKIVEGLTKLSEI